MDRMERVAWLQQHTAFRSLNSEILEAIAAGIVEETWPENRRLILEESLPEALYILHSGHLEQYHTNWDGPAAATSLLPGAVLHLKALLLDQVARYTVITLDDCVLWRIERHIFLDLVQRYPDISRIYSRQLAAELDQVTTQLLYEQQRQAELRPYVVPKAKRGIVGSSRYAVRLRQNIKKAASDRTPVLISGEPGLGKDIAAALIHFGSAARHQPMIKVDCNTLQASGAELFGRAGGKPGLLEWLGTGTLLLNNVQELPPELEEKILVLLETGAYIPVSRDSDRLPIPRSCEARIIMTAEKALPNLGREQHLGHIIKVPPLRVRKADIAAQVQYYISLFCRAKSIAKPTVSPEAIRRLQSYDFPGNLVELESLVERAVIQSDGAPEITEEVFWATSTKGKRFRWNLLNAYPRLRQFLRSPWWPDRINYGFTLAAFAGVVTLLMWGPQTRDRNIGLNLFWAWWWPLILVGFPFVGRLWCAVCPFMIYGELTQTLSLKLWPRQLKDWPRQQAERWGGWFLFGLFTLILLWEELWNLENVAYLSGCLLLLITAGAVIFSLLLSGDFGVATSAQLGG